MAPLYLDLWEVTGTRPYKSNVPAIADSGADVSLVNPDILPRKLLESLRPTKLRVGTANREDELKILGETLICVSRTGSGKRFKLKVLVSPQIEQTLISEKDLKKIGILPPNFPNCEFSSFEIRVNRSAQYGVDFEQLLDKYSDVFDEDDLEPMKATPLHIKLKQNEVISPLGVTKQLRITQDLVQASDSSEKEFFGDRI